jgi:hypothetical protein
LKLFDFKNSKVSFDLILCVAVKHKAFFAACSHGFKKSLILVWSVQEYKIGTISSGFGGFDNLRFSSLAILCLQGSVLLPDSNSSVVSKSKITNLISNFF